MRCESRAEIALSHPGDIEPECSLSPLFPGPQEEGISAQKCYRKLGFPHVPETPLSQQHDHALLESTTYLLVQDLLVPQWDHGIQGDPERQGGQ